MNASQAPPGFEVARVWRCGAVLVVILLAAALRFYRLDAQSFWNDEGNTARLVERSTALIIEGAAGDIHPPGYYLLLQGWRALAGESEFALRGFSALCGVLMVAFTAAIGRRAGGWLTALGSALFVALNPLAVYYGQEARMYALLGLCSALTLWTAQRLVAVTTAPSSQDAPRRRHWPYTLALSACIALGLYTQYAYVFGLVGLNLAFGLAWLARRPWRWQALWPWFVAHLLAGAAFLPWAPIALRAGSWQPPDLERGLALLALARAALVGITLPQAPSTYVLLFALALLLLSGVRCVRPRFVAWAALGVALTPPLLIMILGIYRPAYLKFLMASLPPLGVVLALPLGRAPRSDSGPQTLSLISRVLAALFLLGLIPAQIESLQHLYVDPAYARDDYRGISAAIVAQARPGDAILLSAPNQWEVFTYYYRESYPVYPAPYQPAAEESEAWLADITAQHERLFVLFWGDGESDPQRLIEPLLAQHAYKADDVWIGKIRLARYGVTPPEDVSVEEAPVQFGEAIRLQSWSAKATSSYTAGDVLPLTFVWRAEQAPEQRLKVFVHVLDAQGQLVAQNDMEPVGGFLPSDGWQAGQTLSDRHGVWLPEQLAPGTYGVWLGLYDIFSAERLPIVGECLIENDALWLADISVEKPQ